MQSRDDVRVDLVPHADLIGAIPLAYPWLIEGAKVSQQDIGDILIAICEKRSQLWLITDTAAMKVLGALVTDVRTSNGCFKYVLMHALAGRQMRRWAQMLHSAIYQFAYLAECQAVRFYGRDAWARVFADCYRTGERRSGHALFERVIP